jgi:hypothetical protein
MTIEMQHQVGTETVTVHLTQLQNFEECKEDMKSPLKNMQMATIAGFDPNSHKNVFIKCEIYPANRTMTLLSHRVSGESVCHEVVAEFIKQNFPGKKSMMYQSVFCNHFEMQYRYIIS